MLKKLSIFCLLLAGLSFILEKQADASGFNRLKAAGQGLSSDSAGGGSNDDKGGKGSSSGSGGGKSSGRLGSGPSGLNDIIFLGVFETYLPSKRYNARLTVYGEPRKFLLGHRACTKELKIRDRINTHLFKNPPKTDDKGRVIVKGMDKEIRTTVKKALKTKLEYFTTIYVVSGRYNTNKIPKELKGQSITDCEGVLEKKKEMDKAAAK